MCDHANASRPQIMWLGCPHIIPAMLFPMWLSYCTRRHRRSCPRRHRCEATWRMTSVKDFPTSPSQIRQTLRGCEVGNTDPGMSPSPETLGEFSSAGGLLLAALAGGDQDHPVVQPGQNCTGSAYICRYGPGQGSLIWCRCSLYSSLSGCCVLDYGDDGVFVHTPRPRRILACSRRRHPQHRRYRNVQRY